MFIGSLSSLAAAWWLSTLEVLPAQRGGEAHLGDGGELRSQFVVKYADTWWKYGGNMFGYMSYAQMILIYVHGCFCL